jgi:hypothetical protein
MTMPNTLCPALQRLVLMPQPNMRAGKLAKFDVAILIPGLQDEND